MIMKTPFRANTLSQGVMILVCDVSGSSILDHFQQEFRGSILAEVEPWNNMQLPLFVRC